LKKQSQFFEKSNAHKSICNNTLRPIGHLVARDKAKPNKANFHPKTPPLHAQNRPNLFVNKALRNQPPNPKTKPISSAPSRSAMPMPPRQTTTHHALNPSAKSASSACPAAPIKIGESIVRRRDPALYLTSPQKTRNGSPICRKGNGL